MSRQWGIIGVIVGLIAVLVAGSWFVRDRFAPVGVGSQAPDFVATDLQGRSVRLADLRGEVVLLNIWATWCPPCRDEMPSIQRLYDELSSEGVHIVAVSVDAPAGTFDLAGNAGGDVAAFARDMGLTFPIWVDPTGQVQRAYRATGVPESYVIGRDGRIVRKVIGPLEWDSDAVQDLFVRLLES